MVRKTVGFPKITLKSARVNAGLTQKEAAKKIGIDETTLINWEKDSSNIRARFLPVIEEVYNFPTDFIFFGKTTS